MSQPNRTAAGGRIDRERPLSFRFDGRHYVGHAGDTLASALLANDVHLVARSFKYHRPRGILSMGVEEPNALVQLGQGAYTTPNMRATQVELYQGLSAQSQNRWPSLSTDVGAINDRLSALLPAGFYYKTFMWPAALWMRYERGIRRMAGLGHAPREPDPDRYERMHAHCDVLVVGAGPAGLAAALAAGRAGARVIVADDQCEAGGQLLAERFEIAGRPALAWVGATLAELQALPEVRLLRRTAINAYYDHNFLVGCEQLPGERAKELSTVPRQRLWKIRAREVVLATGAIERPLVFPDNDRPGIMLAASVRGYLNRYGVKPGTRVVIATAADDAYRTALDLAGAGASIVAVADLRAQAAGYLPQQVRSRGIEVLTGARIVGTEGRMRVDAVRVQTGASRVRALACDLLAMCGGWMPSVHLFSQSRGKLEFDAGLGAFVPGAATQAVTCAGMVRGAPSLREALAQGFQAGAAAAARCGFDRIAKIECPPTLEPEETPIDASCAFRGTPGGGKQFVDWHNDVTVADVRLAAREGYDGIEHLKRYTTAGMGVDQGKTGNLNALALLAELRGVPVLEIGTTTFRPPYQPLAFGAIAGADSGALFDPVRRTPMHGWHERHGALFEDVGQWKRPWYYPRPAESMRQAVDRECLAVRAALGILDASTLGKIDIQGPDATEFIDRIYCNSFRTLAPGRCRYGLMLRQDGMVFDDGVSARLSEHHYLMSTTTGGAARVLAWLEEWLQTEWPRLRVYCTSVSEQYAQVAIAGPRCADMLAPLTDVKLDAMPPMSVREGSVAGIPARVFRISFSGAPGYEIAVAAGRGVELWTTLMGAGERFGITPYGTEAMHVLRAEKGFIIVGQETDGTVTPLDLGLDRMVAADKFFIGKRSLARADARRTDRKQLVGLLTESPQTVLPEGTQLILEPHDFAAAPRSPVAMAGHVTSSYYSANCGRSIALALVKAGISRLGETLYAPLDGQLVKVTLTAPCFLDAQAQVRRG
ncbi:MAG: sarcosine oxidase subunit alpha family protein [Burkholderiales bacterium]|nr:sarcosine oxidase subunit alpha family protein [Burkholderiales bacterium]